jgi:hypothetical protein
MVSLGFDDHLRLPNLLSPRTIGEDLINVLANSWSSLPFSAYVYDELMTTSLP